MNKNNFNYPLLKLMATFIFVSMMFIIPLISADIVNTAYDGTNKSIYLNSWGGQSFKVDSSFTIGTISLYLARIGTVTWDYQVNIFNNNLSDDKPIGNPLTKAIINITGLNASRTWVNITLPNIDLSSGNYTIVVNGTGGGDESNQVNWGQSSSSSYTDGNKRYTDNAGSSWTIQTGIDQTFILYDNTTLIQSFNSTTYETAQESFSLSTVYDTAIYSSVSANLVYDGTSYAATRVGSGSPAVFTQTLTIPIGAGTNNFYWSVSFINSTTTDIINSSTNSQIVNPINFGLCNSTLNIPYINYTFKDEQTSSFISSTLTSSFIYYLGDGSVSKTLSFFNNSVNPSYSFCFSPSDRTLFATPSLQYSNTPTYPVRLFNLESPLTLINTTTNTSLFLLNSSSGQFVSFQVLTAFLSPINNALISFSLNGASIQSQLTDSAGVATFFLNPLSIYNMTVSKTGFNTFSIQINPTQTQYTITLSGTSSGNITSFNNGISYVVQPPLPTLINGTTYNFNVTMSSSYFNLNSWGFNITNGSSLLYTNSSGTGGIGNLGNVGGNLNTGNNTLLSLTVFWNVNGTITTQTVYYNIENIAGSGYSINNFNNDLKNYLSTGFFGLTTTGLNLIIFFIIFLVTGVISWKFGLYSPTIIVGLVWVLIIFFDIVLGLVTYPTAFASYHPATTIVGVIFIGLIVREATKY